MRHLMILVLVYSLFALQVFAQSPSLETEQALVTQRLEARVEELETALSELRSGVLINQLRAAGRENFFQTLRRAQADGSKLAPELVRTSGHVIFKMRYKEAFKQGPFPTEALQCLAKFTEELLERDKSVVETAVPKVAAADISKLSSMLVTALAPKELGDEEKGSQDNIANFKTRTTFPGCKEFDKNEIKSKSLSAKNDRISVNWNAQCYPSDANGNNPNSSDNLTNPTVASLQYDRGDQFGARSYCSGTLVAPNVVLTAAHCFCHTGARQAGGRFFTSARSCNRQGHFVRNGEVRRALDPRDLSVFFQHAGESDVEKIVIHPKFRWGLRAPFADFALMVLKTPVVEFPPTKINTIGRVLPGTFGRAVGYGYHRPIRSDGTIEPGAAIVRKTGLKFRGDIQTGNCGDGAQRFGLICWTRKERSENTHLGSTCNGDSGGPIFAESNGENYLVGVTSAGQDGCRVGSPTWNMSTYVARKWLLSEIEKYQPEDGFDAGPRFRAQKYCRICSQCQIDEPVKKCEGDISALPYQCFDRRVVPNLIEVGDSQTERLVVAANCNPQSGFAQSRFAVAALEKNDAQEVEERKVCEKSGTGSTFTCKFAAKQDDKFAIRFTEAATRECQIVVTAYGEE